MQGDTNTVLAAALAASKLHIKVGHVEAGLRSYDRTMPEEINRVVADHISDYLFAPTENSRENLRKEGIAEEKIHVTGNTIVDSVYQNLEIARRKVNVLADLGLKPKEYFLVTAHRQETSTRSSGAWSWFLASSRFPWCSRCTHARGRWLRNLGLSLMASKPLSRWGSWSFCNWRPMPGPGVDGFGRGAWRRRASWGSSRVKLRENTERPETVDVGANLLAGVRVIEMLKATKQMLSQGDGWTSPFSDGKASN